LLAAEDTGAAACGAGAVGAAACLVGVGAGAAGCVDGAGVAAFGGAGAGAGALLEAGVLDVGAGVGDATVDAAWVTGAVTAVTVPWTTPAVGRRSAVALEGARLDANVSAARRSGARAARRTLNAASRDPAAESEAGGLA
jgi:hypothetical protein